VPLGGTERVVAMVFSSEICVGFDFYKIKIFFLFVVGTTSLLIGGIFTYTHCMLTVCLNQFRICD
jgi:hypothetical protein